MAESNEPQARRQYVSITDVAREAKVSVTTVSHVLSSHRPVAAATRVRVLDVIDRLGYRPNELARSMRKQRTQTMGLIVPDITNPFFPAVARGMLDVLTPAGYVGILCDTNGERSTEQAIIDQMVTRRVDAMAIASGHPDDTGLQPVIDAGIPIVHLGGEEASAGIDVVITDDRNGAKQVTSHLIERGYSRIGFITREGAQGPPEQRLAGYLTAHAEHGIEPDERLVVRSTGDRLGGAEGLARLLDGPVLPDAIACVNDIVAIGVLDEMHRRELRVPEDIAIAGFDDVDVAALVSPPLTTVAHQVRDMGRAVARLLLHRLTPEGAAETPQRVVIPADLVVRDST